MIVDSMSHTEVYQELAKERDAVTTWWHCNLEKHRRRVLKSTRFPLRLWFDYTSARKNRYLFFTRIYEKHMKQILTGIAVLRRGSDGMTIYTNWLSDQKLILPMIMIPHFWKRYAERLGVEKTGVDLVKHFFAANPFGKDTSNQKVVARSVRRNGEDHLSCCVNEGVLLGHVVGKFFLVRTFITYDMTCGMQQQVFEERRKNIRTDDEMYEWAKLAAMVNT